MWQLTKKNLLVNRKPGKYYKLRLKCPQYNHFYILMALQLHPYTVVLAVSALTTLITSLIILRRDVTGSTALGGVLLASFIWSGAYAMTWALTDLQEKLLWLKIMYIGVVSVPALFLIFTLQITQHDNWLTSRNLVVLALEPLTILALLWLDVRFMFDQINVAQRGGFTVLQIERGPGFWLNIIYSYALILMAFVALWMGSIRANRLFRRQYLIILIGSMIPFAASLFTQARYKELAELDMAPISFAVMSILYAYAVFRHQFMDLLPVARGRLIESMSDGVLVVDAKGRIVDINPAMKSFLEDEPAALIGRNISEVLNLWSHNVDQLLEGFETRSELKFRGKPIRYLDLRITPLYNDGDALNGRLIVFRDVTDRKIVEQNLRRAMDRLQTQLIEIGTLQSQLREQAIRDALTNVFNRRYLEETLVRELARAERESYPLCLIMMDLDYFKDVNDTHGHEAGDIVLKVLAETVVRQSRHGDFVCRYGGEEFVLVMPNIGIETARQRAEELHQIINSLRIPYGVFTLTTTISMGVAAYPEHGKTKEELLRSADRAMYIAKNTGRNRVVVYPEPEWSAD
jgi:diguanylate cyclase (GGDEF)-like protein/PAS domain S-box-containing protein